MTETELAVLESQMKDVDGARDLINEIRRLRRALYDVADPYLYLLRVQETDPTRLLQAPFEWRLCQFIARQALGQADDHEEGK